MNKVNERVFLYVRVASAEQATSATLDQQETTCRTYCEEHGLQIVDVLREVGSGLCWWKSHVFPQMRQRYLAEEINGVIIPHYRCLGCTTLHAAFLFHEIQEHHLLLFCIQERDDGHHEMQQVSLVQWLQRRPDLQAAGKGSFSPLSQLLSPNARMQK